MPAYTDTVRQAVARIVNNEDIDDFLNTAALSRIIHDAADNEQYSRLRKHDLRRVIPLAERLLMEMGDTTDGWLQQADANLEEAKAHGSHFDQTEADAVRSCVQSDHRYWSSMANRHLVSLRNLRARYD